jgi:L-fuconolactonase
VIVDAHHHLWDLSRGIPYPWLTPDLGPIHRSFSGVDLEPLLAAHRVSRTVIVQCANSHADTDYLLEQADGYAFIAGVVGWAPLLDAQACAATLERRATHPRFRGIRHLVHDEPDPDWLLRPAVRRSLPLLAGLGLVLDVPAVYPRHLGHVATLAAELPELTIVIDHLGKPPFRREPLGPWAELVRAVATHPNVVAKLSGLDTAVGSLDWTAEELRPAFEVALEAFGPDRLLAGSDWPVSVLGGGYARVWKATYALLAPLSAAEREAILGGTASRVYALTADAPPAPSSGAAGAGARPSS